MFFFEQNAMYTYNIFGKYFKVPSLLGYVTLQVLT